jgi:DNA recombination protein RmuC
MDIGIFIIGCIVVIGFAGLFIFLKSRLDAPRDRSAEQGFVLLQNQMAEMARVNEALRKSLDDKLQEANRQSHAQFSSSAAMIKEITEKMHADLVKIDATNRQVALGMEQIRGLEDILKNPKQRGILGEYLLETLLKNVFPPGQYEMQYAFNDGEIVDAAVFYGTEGERKIIPIDSKFSLENYNRLVEAKGEDERLRLEKAFRADLKNRIDETAKYVRPHEGTMDFAFMFIPAEAIYYDLLVNRVGAVSAQDLIEYAMKERKVVIVSPTSFLAYLQTVIQGIRREHFHKEVEAIIKRVQDLGRHLKSYEAYFAKIGGHLGTTVNAWNAASKELGKIDRDVLKIGGEGIGIEAQLLEKPQNEEHTGA